MTYDAKMAQQKARQAQAAQVAARQAPARPVDHQAVPTAPVGAQHGDPLQTTSPFLGSLIGEYPEVDAGMELRNQQLGQRTGIPYVPQNTQPTYSQPKAEAFVRSFGGGPPGKEGSRPIGDTSFTPKKKKNLFGDDYYMQRS